VAALPKVAWRRVFRIYQNRETGHWEVVPADAGYENRWLTAYTNDFAAEGMLLRNLDHAVGDVGAGDIEAEGG